MPPGVAARINVQQLENLVQTGHGDDYVIQDRSGLALSRQPLKKHFLFVPYGQSDKHARGLRDVRNRVQNQFGVNVRADGNLLTARSLLQQIRAAKDDNRRTYHQIVDRVRQQHGAQHAAFTSQDLAAKHLSGEALSIEQANELQLKLGNRLDRDDFAETLRQQFGQAAKDAFVNSSNDKMVAGAELTDQEKAHWLAYAKTRAAGIELVAKVGTELGDNARQAATNILQTKLQTIARLDAELPPEVAQGGQLPKSWSDDMIKAGRKRAETDIGQRFFNGAQARQQALDLAAGKADRLTTRARRLVDIETKLTQDSSGGQLKANASDLFERGALGDDGDVFRLCDDLIALDQAGAKHRLETEHPQTAIVGQRFDEAVHVARLGKQLEARGVAPEAAALLLRAELAERQAGRGDNDPSRFSPVLAQDLNASVRLAERGAELIENGRSPAEVDDILQAEFSERVRGRIPLNRNQFSNTVLRLVNDNTGLLAMLREHGVSAATYLNFRAQGAANRIEVISCAKLGVSPHALDVDPQAMSEDTRARYHAWANAGFNRAERQAYMGAQVLNPRFARYRPADLADYAGSNLTPDQMIAYKSVGQAYNPATRVGQLNAENQVGDRERLGSGFCNTVYRTTYQTTTGPQQRVFKPELTPGRVQGLQMMTDTLPGQTRRNVACHRIDTMLGFGVVPKADFAISKDHQGNEQLGVAMDVAPGQDASKWKTQYGGGLMDEDTPGSNIIEVRDSTQFDNLLRHKDRIAADPRLANTLAKRLGVDAVFVDSENRLKVRSDFLRSNRDNTVWRRETTKLQLEDVLFAQKDRHKSNYMVDIDKNGKVTKVTGVDNDMTQDQRITNHRQMVGQPKVVDYPAVVDRVMYDAVIGLDEQEVRANLNGVLTGNEINAFVSRMNGLKQHLRGLPPDRIIEPDQWGQKWVGDLMTKKNSYAMRDAA